MTDDYNPAEDGRLSYEAAIEAKRLRAIQFHGQRSDRLLAQHGVRGGQVDQVAVVGDDGMEALLADPGSKERDFIGRQRPRPPLADGFRENLQRLATRGCRAIHGPRQAASD